MSSNAFQIRLAVHDDALAVARVHVRSWQVAYRGLLPAEYLSQLKPEDRAARYNFRTKDPKRPSTLVAIEGGVLVGFSTVAPAEDLDAIGKGELCALYVDPDGWGRGIGRALVERARTRLRDSGFRQAIVWAMAGNERAQQFYRRDGWASDGTQRTESVWGVRIDATRLRRSLG